jgi:hypothetical protein
MITSLLQNKFKVIGIIVLVTSVAWYVLSSSGADTGTDSLLTSDTSVSINDVDQDVVTTLLQLRAIQLNSGIFSDHSFMSLKDFSIPIVPEPIGRPDPFAPLSSSIQASVGTKTTKGAPSFKGSTAR